MIRPITVATFLMACGSGLYLYQEKHDAQVLDQQIARTVHETAGLRDQSRVLAAEWTMLNDPERLRQYSDTYLTLKSILPTQFTSLANLDSRLPAVIPPDDQDADQTVASADGTDQPAATDVPPRPPLPPAAQVPQVSGPAAAATRTVTIPAPAEAPATLAERRPGVTEARRIAEARPVDQRPIDLRPSEARAPDTNPADVRLTDTHPADPRAPEGHGPGAHAADTHVADARVFNPHAAEARPTDSHLAEARPVQQQPRQAAASVRVASERPVPYGAPRVPAPVSAGPTPVSAPYGGSLLGMARSAPPAPRPMPVNASNWYNGN
jgi:hypothetical protein